jgi:uncharacterized protein (TIGR03067 family)
MRVVLFGGLLPLILGIPVPEPEDPAPGADLQGKWACVKYADGYIDDPSIRGGISMRVEKDTLVYSLGQRETTYKFRVDPKQSPAWIDVVPQDPALKGRICPGIFKYDDGVLILVINSRGIGERPKEFTAPVRNAGHELFHFRKAKE